MNAIKFNHYISAHLKRSISPAVLKRCFSSEGKLVDVQVNSKTGVYTVAMQRPPVNGLNLELVNDLTCAITTIEKEKGKGMIITSSSPGIFTAGIDLMELYKPKPDRLKAYWKGMQDMWLKLYGAGYSTVAAISGHAPGAGCLISVSCDYRVMVNGKYGIGLNETQLGLSAPLWFIETFRNILPVRISEMALISGKMFSVEEALQVGLIDEIAADNAEAISKAEKYISSLSRLPPLGVAQTKHTIREGVMSRLVESRETDLRIFQQFVTSPETQKGLEMYLEGLKKK